MVELLVVIGIISTLIAILLPALSKAREAAKSVQCMSNIRQIGQAVFMYAQDNKGMFPPQSYTSGSYYEAWIGFMAPYLPGALDSGSDHHMKKIHCPNYDGPVSGTSYAYSYTGYSWNGSLHKHRTPNDSFQRLSSFPVPSKTPFIWDDQQLGGAYNDFYDGGYPEYWQPNGGSYYRLAFRHGHVCNIGLLDGHVESIKLRPIKTNLDRNTMYEYQEYHWYGNRDR